MHDLLLALVRFRLREKAKTFQSELASFSEAIKPSVSEIWKTEPAEGASEESGQPHQFGPEATIADIVQGRKDQTGKGYRPPYEIMGKKDLE